ncbi:hypothetical protein [Sphingobacterium sp. BIGb0165]|uniref:hypothetical protein n=1 Tax=Sphingobacterium sp. BIGb0165 TaxID=2940615 RepID=UPI0021698CD6|nr:hypothetical protein [Sphingobacterium sp. BIGb0165]MCS4225891.1 hypothetical protein [Sphingobacterium sp. BIGb0165]
MKLNDIRISAIGGTICSIWSSLSLDDVLSTILTASLGTLVSFVTSRLLGRYWRQKKQQK